MHSSGRGPHRAAKKGRAALGRALAWAGVARALVAAGVVAAAGGCVGPLERSSEARLREELIASNRAHLQTLEAAPTIAITREPTDPNAQLKREWLEAADRTSGPTAYRDDELELGPDLAGQADQAVVYMSLQRAIESAVRHNLELRQARILPAIAETQVTQAEAAFDAVFFSGLDWQNLDTPRPPSPGFAIFGSQKSQVTSFSGGIRKPLANGGQITVGTDFARNFQDPSSFAPGGGGFVYYSSDVLVTLTQPLLRNFGDINRAQILLSQGSRQQQAEELNRQLQATLGDTEEAYWNLVLARHRLLIQARLLGRTIEDRNILKVRMEANWDVSPVRLAEANSFVAARRSNVTLARADLRSASDKLKRLINVPELPLTGETLILPLDAPPDLSLSYNLLDAVTTALRRRPELREALSRIEDTAVRLRVAENALLPVLNLQATVRSNSIGSGVPGAYSNLRDGDYIDYLLQTQFEMPLGNRQARSLLRQRQLERRATVVAYQRAAQDVILDVKNTLRQLQTSFEIVESSRTYRRAAAENLRALTEQENAGVQLTPEFLLDLKLGTQQRLADAELQEIQALTSYNTTIARFYQAMGTLLERNHIEFNPSTWHADEDQKR